MTKHRGDSEHRYKEHPKKPKIAKCRMCKGPLKDRPYFRKGSKRIHEGCE